MLPLPQTLELHLWPAYYSSFLVGVDTAAEQRVAYIVSKYVDVWRARLSVQTEVARFEVKFEELDVRMDSAHQACIFSGSIMEFAVMGKLHRHYEWNAWSISDRIQSLTGNRLHWVHATDALCEEKIPPLPNAVFLNGYPVGQFGVQK